MALSHTGGRNTLACDPGGERFKFQVESPGAKGREGLSAYSVVLREAPLSAPQRLTDRDTDTHTHAP